MKIWRLYLIKDNGVTSEIALVDTYRSEVKAMDALIFAEKIARPNTTYSLEESRA